MNKFSYLDNCKPCNVTLKTDIGRPSAEDFQKYLPNFLTRNPDMSCAKAGHAAYGKVIIVISLSMFAFIILNYHFICTLKKNTNKKSSLSTGIRTFYRKY